LQATKKIKAEMKAGKSTGKDKSGKTGKGGK